MANPTDPKDPRRPHDPNRDRTDSDVFAELMAEEVVEGEVEPAPGEGQPSGSAVDLGQPRQAPASAGPTPTGESVVWASLVNETPSGGSGGEPAKFDAPSDADLRALAAGGPADTGVNPQDEEAIPSALPPGGAESSRVNLTDPPPAEDPLLSASHAHEGHYPPVTDIAGGRATDEAIDIPHLVEPLPDDHDSSVHFGGDEDEDQDALSGSVPAPDPNVTSAVDLGGAASKPESSAIDIGSDEMSPSDSALDLEGAALLDEEESSEDYPNSSVLAVAGSEVLPEQDSASDMMVGRDAGPPSATSGLDLGTAAPAAPTAEAPSGSGLDLGVSPPPAPASASGPSGLDLGALGEATPPASGPPWIPAAVTEDPLSGIDLGTVPSGAGDSSRDLIAEAVESGVDLTGAGSQLSEEEMDVDYESEPNAAAESSAVDLGAATFEDDIVAAPIGGETVGWQPEPALAPRGTGSEGTGEVELGGPRATGSDSDQGTLEEERPDYLDMGTMGIGGEEPSATSSAADEEHKKEEKAAPPPPAPKYGRRWAGGILVGSLLTGAACVGLWAFGVEPPPALREMVGTEVKAPPGKGGGPTTPPKPTKQVADVRKLVATADFAEEVPSVDENDVHEVAARGEFTWLKHLHRADPKTLKVDDAAVQQAMADLKKANTADARLWLGHIYETLKNPAEARKVYEAGVKEFATTPAERERFEGALDRLDITTGAPPKPAGAGARLPSRFDPRYLLQLAVGQPPVPMPGDAPQPEVKLPEAGFSFWKAVRQAQVQNYADAVKLIDEARDKHLARSRSQLRKAQNPVSDPDEKIFLRTCEELKAFWKIQEKLKAGGYLKADQSDPAKAVDAALTALSDSIKANATVKQDLETARADKTKADQKITTLEGNLKKEKDATTDALAQVKDREDKLKKAAADLKAETARVAEATRRGDDLDIEKKERETALAKVADTVKLKDFDPKTGQKALVQKVADIVDVADTKDPGSRLRASMDEARRLDGVLKERWEPSVMLGYWLPLMSDRDQKTLAGSAVRDVQRVASDRSASAESRALAKAVEGLALRNQGEYDKARQALQAAVDSDAGDSTGWKKAARTALDELTNPNAYFVPRAEELRSLRRHDDALALLTQGLKVFPQRGVLLALRGQVKLDAALDKAKTRPDAAALNEVKDDAAAAIKAGDAAAGNYLLGRVAEEMGQRDEAVAAYRKAVSGAAATDPRIDIYRLALARMLLQPAEGKSAALPRRDRLPRPEELVTLLLVAVQPPPAEEAANEEAVKLADAILARPDIDSLPLLKAQAQAVKGLYTQALKTYADGLRPQLGRDQGDVLRRMIDSHPALRRPDTQLIPNPARAEKHWAAGLAMYNDRDFAGAQKEFERAIENFPRDARYYYYLGLSRLQQNQRGWAEDFEQGARLELDDRPARAAVDAILERVQGRARRLIGEARVRARQ